MSSDFYRTHAWRKKREWQLLEEPTCRLCRELFKRITVATVADHIEPHRGDPTKFWEGGLQSLCPACHSSTKQRIERRGSIRGWRADGTAIDPNSPWNSKKA